MSDLRGYTQTEPDNSNKTVKLILTIVTVLVIIAAGIFVHKAVTVKPVSHQPPAFTTSSVLSQQRPA